MMNKATARDDNHETMTWGAAQLGIGQGVLDAVADGLLEATDELSVLVAVWVDPNAGGSGRGMGLAGGAPNGLIGFTGDTSGATAA